MSFSFYRALVIIFLLITGVFLFQKSGSLGGKEKVLHIVDTSLSMSVEDIERGGSKISRLEGAKELIKKTLQKEGVESAVITYARRPTLLTPLSSATQESIKLIASIEPVGFAGGSDLVGALNFAKDLYSDTALQVYLYTDGGSTSSEKIEALPTLWKTKIYGLGTEEGDRIPLGYNADGTRRYKYYSGSDLVVGYEKDIIEDISDIQRVTELSDDIYSYIGKNNSFTPLLGLSLIFLGFFLHPYVRKKNL